MYEIPHLTQKLPRSSKTHIFYPPSKVVSLHSSFARDNFSIHRARAKKNCALTRDPSFSFLFLFFFIIVHMLFPCVVEVHVLPVRAPDYFTSSIDPVKTQSSVRAVFLHLEPLFLPPPLDYYGGP